MHRTRRLLPLIVILSLGQLTACSETDSTDVRTSGVRAEIDVVAEGDGATTVTADLEVGSGGFFATDLELAGGDTLTAMAFGLTQTLSKVSQLLTHYYRTTFSQDTEGEQFTVSLSRPNDTSAPNSFVTLPVGFVLSMLSPDPVNVGDDLSVGWAPQGQSGTLELVFETTCTIDRHEIVVDDQGNQTTVTTTTETTGFTSFVPADTGAYMLDSMDILPMLLPNEEFKTAIPCTVSLQLSRINEGLLDPNYGAGGYIRARQRRTVALTLNIQSLGP